MTRLPEQHHVWNAVVNRHSGPSTDLPKPNERAAKRMIEKAGFKVPSDAMLTAGSI